MFDLSGDIMGKIAFGNIPKQAPIESITCKYLKKMIASKQRKIS